MRERGRVTEIAETFTRIQLEVSAACESCVDGSCSVVKRSMEARSSPDLRLKLGDIVEIEMNSGEATRGALLVFGPPAFLFAAGYAVGRLAFPAATGEAPGALLGLFGMGLGVLAAILASRGRRAGALPLITRRLGPGFAEASQIQ